MKYPKRMSSGRYIDLSDIKREDIILSDIVTAINHIFRFTGHYDKRKPLTVGQHSLMCMRLAEEAGESSEVQLACLVHDFAEAYVGDVSTPLKRLMGKHWIDFASPIETIVDEVCLPFENTVDMHHVVKMYDLMALDIERRCMWNNRGKDMWPDVPKSYGKHKEMVRVFSDVQGYGFDTPIEHNYHRLILEVT